MLNFLKRKEEKTLNYIMFHFNLKEEDLVKDSKGKLIAAWVTGIKGTCFDMTCRNFKYELNKEYSMNIEDVELCSNGFHFCYYFRDVLSHYPMGRYFEVKGCVPIEQLIKKEENIYDTDFDSKLAAYKIKFIKELSFKEISCFSKNIENLGEELYNQMIKEQESILIEDYLRDKIKEIFNNNIGDIQALLLALKIKNLDVCGTYYCNNFDLNYKTIVNMIKFIVDYCNNELHMKYYTIFLKLKNIAENKEEFMEWVDVYYAYLRIKGEN